ncbi:MAG: hypothetical protein HYT75_02435, partial [Deltaproteobacteria bacterium]|nr:hypothetical protein [Deltaproteobacteria bacterium]
MADVSQNFLKHYYISVSPENVAQFQENVAAWLKPYACEDEREEGGCVMEWEIRKALAGILKDGKVDRIEAPLLFDIADALDGLNTNDQILDAGEADTILYSPQIADPDDVLKLFQPDTARRDAVIGSLEEAKRLLTNTISSVERVRHRLLEDETSYLNFVSAQNLLGLSAWFSLDEALISPLEFTGAQFKFAPFSAIEFTGVRRVLQQLYAIRAGLLIFLEYYKSGIIYDRGQFVNAFLNSPFEIYAQTGHFLSGEISTDIEGRAPQYHLDFAAGMVRMAVDAKATKLAEHMRTVFVKTDNEYEQDYIDKPLPSLAFRLIDGPMISVCNYVVSLDDFIGLALGGVFGKVLAAVHKLYKAVKKIEKMIGHAKYILPGAAPFKTKPEETVLGWRGLKFMGNLAYEYFKGGLFIYGGHLIDEKDGAKWGARIYIFGLGSKVSFDSGYKTEAVKGILSGDKN